MSLVAFFAKNNFLSLLCSVRVEVHSPLERPAFTCFPLGRYLGY